MAPNLNETEIDSVVRNEIIAPAGTGVVIVIRLDVGLSTETTAAPAPVTLNTPILATPVPVISMTVPAGNGAAELAVNVNPGQRTPSVPQLPASLKSPRSNPGLAAACGAAMPMETTGTAHAAPLTIMRRANLLEPASEASTVILHREGVRGLSPNLMEADHGHQRHRCGRIGVNRLGPCRESPPKPWVGRQLRPGRCRSRPLPARASTNTRPAQSTLACTCEQIGDDAGEGLI